MSRVIRALAIVLLALALAAPLAVQAQTVEDVGQNFMCQCGCNSQLPNCIHGACDVRDKMNAAIATMLSQGKSVAQISASFVAQYGEQVLAVPPKKGFNLTAWIAPFVGIAAGGVGLFFVLRAWVKRGNRPMATAEVEVVKPAVKDAYRERLEKELNDFGKGQP